MKHVLAPVSKGGPTSGTLLASVRLGQEGNQQLRSLADLHSTLLACSFHAGKKHCNTPMPSAWIERANAGAGGTYRDNLKQ